MPTVANYLAEQLKQVGVTIVYGLPGGENVEILDAIRRQNIEFMLVKNESSAIYMAGTHARLTGGIGVALTTLGPGATNAYVGLAHAYLDREPVLLITAQTDPHLIGTHTHQVLDLQACFSPITRFTTELSSDNAVSSIAHGISMLQSGRPCPVHLSINNRVALQNITQPQSPPISNQPTHDNLNDVLEIMRALINTKQKPIIIVGLGLEPSQPYTSIQQLAETLGAPVIDTPKSKGALPAQHPLYAGTIGLTRTDPAYEILDESDCIIAVGFDVVELVKPWSQSQSLIWIANWANQDPRIPCDIEYIGNITPLLQKLASTCKKSTSDNWGETRLTNFHKRLNAIALPTPQDNRILPQHVLQAIRNVTPDDIIITTDVGSHKIFTALNWKAQSPNSYFVSNGLSAMGFGLVSAIAAAHTTGKPAICITGDAGLAMGIGELILLKDYALPVIIVVMNDTALDLIRSAQKRRNRPVFGTEFSNPDYSLIAKAYTLDYAQIQDSATCESALASALTSGRPTLIEAMIDPISYPTTVK